MEIVIDIPQSLYANLSKIKHETVAGKRILECVKNGTPLPKGHGKLIEANENLYQEIRKWVGVDVASDIIANAPTIIEADKESE